MPRLTAVKTMAGTVVAHSRSHREAAPFRGQAMGSTAPRLRWPAAGGGCGGCGRWWERQRGKPRQHRGALASGGVGQGGVAVGKGLRLFGMRGGGRGGDKQALLGSPCCL